MVWSKIFRKEEEVKKFKPDDGSRIVKISKCNYPFVHFTVTLTDNIKIK